MSPYKPFGLCQTSARMARLAREFLEKVSALFGSLRTRQDCSEAWLGSGAIYEVEVTSDFIFFIINWIICQIAVPVSLLQSGVHRKNKYETTADLLKNLMRKPGRFMISIHKVSNPIYIPIYINGAQTNGSCFNLDRVLSLRLRTALCKASADLRASNLPSVSRTHVYTSSATLDE